MHLPHCNPLSRFSHVVRGGGAAARTTVTRMATLRVGCVCLPIRSITLGQVVQAGRRWGLLDHTPSSRRIPPTSFSASSDLCTLRAATQEEGKPSFHPPLQHHWGDGSRGGKGRGGKGGRWYRCGRVGMDNPFSGDQPSTASPSSSFGMGKDVCPRNGAMPMTAGASAIGKAESDVDVLDASFEDVCRKQSFLHSASRVPSHSRVALRACHVNQIHIEGVVRGIFVGFRHWEGDDGLEKNKSLRNDLIRAWQKIEQRELKEKEEEKERGNSQVVEAVPGRKRHAGEESEPLSVGLSDSRRSLWEADYLLFDTPTATTTSSPPISTTSSLPPLQLLVWLSIADSQDAMYTSSSEPLIISCPLSSHLISELEHEVRPDPEQTQKKGQKKEEGAKGEHEGMRKHPTSTSPPHPSVMPITSPCVPSSFLHEYFSSHLVKKRVIVSGELREQERYDGDLHRIVSIPYILLPTDGFGRSIQIL